MHSLLAKAFQERGTWELQDSIEKKVPDVLKALEMALPGRVLDLVDCKFANHVLQAIVLNLPIDSPVCEATMKGMLTNAVGLAVHKFGCRVLCRVIEHGMHHHLAMELVDKLLAHEPFQDLVVDQFGSHVLEKVLEHSDLHRSKVADLLRGNLCRFASDTYGSFLVEKALEHCVDQQKSLCEELLQQRWRWVGKGTGCRHIAKKVAALTGQVVPGRGGQKFRKKRLVFCQQGERSHDWQDSQAHSLQTSKSEVRRSS